MSGIFGKIGKIENSGHELSSMSETLVHRGPDDEGLYKGDGIILGCRLLRTRGPEEGRQPISSESGDVHAVMDGAIYNGDTLRRELESRSYTFHMNSDAELLIRLYEEEGLDCVKRLRGHFAFAIWDNRLSRLVLARDHLGQKPLFYSQFDGKLYFASEVKALLPVMPTTAEIDFESLDRYLSMRFIPGSGTMVRGIKKLSPAHLLVHEHGNISVSQYWRLSFAEKMSLSHDDYIEGLEHKFQETVAAHLTENEATGAFLSGGLDSSLIVAMMAREAKEPVSTFSIGFAEKEFDEISFARIVSEKFATRQYEAQADTDLIKALPTIIDSLGEPSDPVAMSFYTASRLAAGHVKVVLGGDGGNELFAGCDRYRGVLLSRYYSLIPSPVRKAIVSPLINAMPASFGYDSLKMKLRWFEKMSGIQGLGECLAEAVSFFRFCEDEKDLLLTTNVRQRLDRGSAAKEISDRYYESDAEHPIERMLYTDYCTRLPEHLLMLVDRMGMAHSLEIRSPLVDKELVEYMAAFPLNMKVRGQKSRYIWYRLAERLLPPAISKRKKRGFRFPLAYWFAVKLNPFLHNVFEDSVLVDDGIFNREYMLKLVQEHRDQKVDHSWKIWMLLNLEIWYRMTIHGFSLEKTQEWIERHVNNSSS